MAKPTHDCPPTLPEWLPTLMLLLEELQNFVETCPSETWEKEATRLVKALINLYQTYPRGLRRHTVVISHLRLLHEFRHIDTDPKVTRLRLKIALPKLLSLIATAPPSFGPMSPKETPGTEGNTFRDPLTDDTSHVIAAVVDGPPLPGASTLQRNEPVVPCAIDIDFKNPDAPPIFINTDGSKSKAVAFMPTDNYLALMKSLKSGTPSVRHSALTKSTSLEPTLVDLGDSSNVRRSTRKPKISPRVQLQPMKADSHLPGRPYAQPCHQCYTNNLLCMSCVGPRVRKCVSCHQRRVRCSKAKSKQNQPDDLSGTPQ
ncbi:hypothetical protein CVT26_008034 [Gymnopilus dilepis]|uniref:Uncharacterized protein n=1 Tax=Gymnopilus dilepis TaxID=231916 RepID=A0A409YJQ6_9AGAR|nr:hypothetical protein CVT26_008034 [Gymnopilus dilepis]